MGIITPTVHVFWGTLEIMHNSVCLALSGAQEMIFMFLLYYRKTALGGILKVTQIMKPVEKS